MVWTFVVSLAHSVPLGVLAMRSFKLLNEHPAAANYIAASLPTNKIHASSSNGPKSAITGVRENIHGSVKSLTKFARRGLRSTRK